MYSIWKIVWKGIYNKTIAYMFIIWTLSIPKHRKMQKIKNKAKRGENLKEEMVLL